ncbi:MAG: AMP-binding protein [Bacteroidia bacterium]|nr:AMP-binding protein [Bacteroidia bacterium]
MTIKYNEVHHEFKLNDFHFDKDGLCEVAYSFIKEGDFFEKEMGDFLLNWMDEHDYIYVETSGTTGKKKKIKLSKQAMVNSALATGKHFKLEPGDRALHCMPASFIAGKMMMVRAIVLGLKIDIVTPSSHPFEGTLKDYDFAALVPLQLQNSLEYLDRVKTLIVGGAAVTRDLIDKVKYAPCEIFETFGMTETITHIATRPINNLNGNDLPPFTAMEDVTISTDDRNCLVVTAHHLNDEKIVTNDVIKIHSENTFELIGRIDNVINTGGIKVFPERIERKLDSIIHERFFITDQRDDVLGYRVVLILESDSEVMENVDFSSLDKYQIPKAIFTVPKFAETASGKINRRKTLDLVRKKYNIKKRKKNK